MKQFSDLVAIPDIQVILDSFYSANGITTEILDLDSQLVVVSSGQITCDEFRRDIPQPQSWRWPSKEEIVSKINEKTSKRDECLHGLFKYARGIRIENKDIATIFLGPVFHAPPDEQRFRLLAKESGFDEAAYLESVRRVPIVAEGQAEGYIEILVQLIQLLAEKGLKEQRLT